MIKRDKHVIVNVNELISRQKKTYRPLNNMNGIFAISLSCLNHVIVMYNQPNDKCFIHERHEYTMIIQHEY